MLKKFVMLSVLVVTQISAMDGVTFVNEHKPNKVFSFEQLPIKALDCLTKILILSEVESEKEFIARTKAMVSARLPEDCKKYLAPKKTIFGSIELPNRTTVAYCPCEINVALLDSECVLKLIDCSKQKKLHELAIANLNYSHLAISSHADMFATLDIKKEIELLDESYAVSKIIRTLRVQNIATKKTQEYVLPDSIACWFSNDNLKLAFNKQGTQVILYGNDTILSHKIIPLTVNTRKVPETLQDYFEQKGVCKKLILQ